jgi:hypothetical protein
MKRLYVLLVSVVIAVLLIAAATAASAAPAQHQGEKVRPLPLYYGALYVSPSMLTSYWGGSATTQSKALTQARNTCVGMAANDCRRGVWVRNGFAAFARAANGAWGTGWGSTAALANEAAVATCRSGGGGACSVTGTNRTLRYNPNSPTTGGP